MMNTAIWFRNDLRVMDNPALIAACSSGQPVVGFYIYTPQQLDSHHVGDIKKRFIVESVAELSDALHKLGINLIAVSSTTFEASTDALVKLCHQHKVSNVFANAEPELNEVNRDILAKEKLGQHNIGLNRYHDQTLIQPGEVVTESGTAYKVYSAFKRSWLKQIQQTDISPLPKPKTQLKTTGRKTAKKTILSWAKPQPRNGFWPAGSDAAHKLLRRFIKQPIFEYHENRDLPSIEGTAKLSPYLAVGSISPKTCMYAALQANEFNWDSHQPGVVAWLNELIWREFYKHLTQLTPDISKGYAFQRKTGNIPWLRNDELFEKWKAGKTGYPMVDAGMRQLKTTGWMHNRLRMVTAMFLTKHLFIDWRMGEKYFMEMLIDGDFCANNGGWQWCASTGADAAPYFRIFNPERQSQRFDKEGDYIRTWVPELNELSNRDIHNPAPLLRESCDYPAPMVNHKEATTRTKEAFQSLSLFEAI